MSMFEALPSAPVAAAATSFAATLSLAAGAAPIPATVPTWLPYLTTILGPLLVLLFGRILAADAARRRSLAASQKDRAQRLRSDADKSNDAEADKLEDSAAGNLAVADAEEALKPRP